MVVLTARAKITQFRDQLASEIDSNARRRVEDLLVQEENKLGANLELLNNINKHLADGRRRIKQQNARVIDMEQSGNDSKLLTEAKALLDGMRDTQQLHLRYRLYVLRAPKENALID